MHHFTDYIYFLAQSITVIAVILITLLGCLAIIARAKEKNQVQAGKLHVKDLNQNYQDLADEMQQHTLSKTDLKLKLKQKKKTSKQQAKQEKKQHNKKSDDSSKNKKNIFVLNFHGDIKASAVDSLSREISAILLTADQGDQVLVRLESGGGMVNCYGLAAAQLQRLRQAKIKLIIAVDKVAASGGYMMAAVADHVIASPFAIIGSIGVIAQLPNFHRWLDKHDIDFEQITAGKYKRTLTMFGKNDAAGREKMQSDVEKIHVLFQDFIQKYRPQIDLKQVATGEYWYGSQALDLQLVDALNTSEDWLLKAHSDYRLTSVRYITKRSLGKRLANKVSLCLAHLSQQQREAIR